MIDLNSSAEHLQGQCGLQRLRPHQGVRGFKAHLEGSVHGRLRQHQQFTSASATALATQHRHRLALLKASDLRRSSSFFKAFQGLKRLFEAPLPLQSSGKSKSPVPLPLPPPAFPKCSTTSSSSSSSGGKAATSRWLRATRCCPKLWPCS